MSNKVTFPWRDKRLQSSVTEHFKRLQSLGLTEKRANRCVAEADDATLDAATKMSVLLEGCNRERNCTKEEKCLSIWRLKDATIHADSLTALANEAVARFGLTVGDILAMKPGQKMRVWLMDRNIGEGFSNKTRGDKINLADALQDASLTVGLYEHSGGLTGKMTLVEVGNEWDPFVWEVNLAALHGHDDLFWGPLGGDCDNSCKRSKKKIDIDALDPRIKVGWRGPSISLEHQNQLPKTFTYYHDALNDYVPWLKKDLTDFSACFQ